MHSIISRHERASVYKKACVGTRREDEHGLETVSRVSKAWEDNVGTQNLANSKGPLMTSRTKHIGIKYHWFRSKIQPNSIDILRIDTKQQRADIFTKGLTRFEFEMKRKLVMGW